MNANIKIILIVLLSVCTGVAIGYFSFGRQAPDTTHMEQHGETNHTHSNNTTTNSKEEIWTCSMDPQIRQGEPGQCPICGMDLILLEENTSSDPLVLEMTEHAAQLANIQTTTVGGATKPSNPNNSITLSGKVQVDERLAASLVSHVPGRIEKLHVTFTGEQVRRGQKIATIYSPQLVTAQQELLEAIKLKDLNPNLAEAARNKLRFLKIGENTIQQIEDRGTVQENFDLYAEASGIISNKRVAVGDYVRQGEVLFEVMDLSKVWILFDAYEEDLANIKVGDPIEFTTPSVPNKTFTTRVSFIDPIINPQTRTAAVRAEVSNKNRLLKPETFVNGLLEKRTNTNNTQLSIPKSAVLWTGTRSVAYVKIPDATIPSFQYREIELGEANGNSYQVVSGLEAGEEVVTNGNFTIDAAAQLNNQASMMNRNVAIKSEVTIEVIPDYITSTPDNFKKQLDAVVDAYLLIKDALVATDAAQGTTSANTLLEKTEKVDMALLKGEAHMYWMEQLEAIEAHSKMIAAAKDIETQRIQFDFLTKPLIKAVKAFGIAEEQLFVQFCPMVFNNEGAAWLSKQEAILNPYFGEKMLRCGTVKETITF